MSQTSTLTVPARFRGPARSGNGGWTAGRLAASALWTDEWATPFRDAIPRRNEAPPLAHRCAAVAALAPARAVARHLAVDALVQG